VNPCNENTLFKGVSVKMDKVVALDEEISLYLKGVLQTLGYRTDAVSYNEKVP
jgi:hypothetical protein